MAIKTGIGVGSAQVFDTSGVVGNFAKMLQKQQQDEAKFQTEIADLIAKVDTKGVRDADKMEIANMYDATKELYRQAAQAKNFQEKALLRSKISKAVNDINEYAYNSANFSKRYADLGKEVLTNSWAYDPKIVDKFRSLANQSLLKMGGAAALDPSEYQKIPNERSRENVFSDIKRQGEDFASSKFVREGNREREVKTLSDNYVADNIYKKFLSNPEYKFKAIYDFKQANPDIEITDEAIVANELAKYKTSFGTTYMGSASRIPKERADRDEEDRLTYRQGLISGLINKDKDSLNELIAMLPANSKAEYRISKNIPGISKGGFNLIRVSIPAASSPSGIDIVEDIPLQAGKPVIRINSLLNQYSGENVKPSIISIKGGKRTGEKFEVKSNRPDVESVPSATKAEWRAAGWSDAQIDEAVKSGKIKVK